MHACVCVCVCVCVCMRACFQLAKGDVMAFNIGVAVRLTLDEGYDPPQGRCGDAPDCVRAALVKATDVLGVLAARLGQRLARALRLRRLRGPVAARVPP